jgi:hypothetical protein
VTTRLPRRATTTDPLEQKIEAALEPGSYIKDDAGRAFVQGLDWVEEKIAKLLRTAPARAVALYETFLAGCYEKADELDDSSGRFGMFVDRLFSGWVKARQAAGADPEDRPPRAIVAHVDAEAVAEDVEETVLGLDLDDLEARAGRKSWGYVEPTEAAWELLGEAVDPFVDEMKRHIRLGFEAAAIATCAGIVLGLYRCRGENSHQLLGCAEDFPAETAEHAVAALARESSAKHRAWRLPETIVARVPEWADMIGRASSLAAGRR